VQLALRIAPQHSTQYADMAARLAEPELRASPLGSRIARVEHATLGGSPYLLVDLDGDAAAAELPALGATSDAFELVDGTLLRPLDRTQAAYLPRELAEARRYKGKTSEVFTRVLLNLALFAGEHDDGPRLRVLDPLAGGGTTLFAALAAGHDSFGIELVRKNVETTAAFVREFCKEARIPHREIRDAKGRRRYRYELGPRDDQRHLVLIEGDSRQASELLRDAPGGARVHAVVGDLPYGIQHPGDVRALIDDALPAWQQVLVPGGALALAWNATRVPRAHVVAAFDRTGLRVLDEPPYDGLEHRVDRVIKSRDVVVAVKPTA
jgi:SAM-dependent methyltransferase